MASLDDYLAFQRRREADKVVAANLGRLLSSHAARQQPQLEQQIMRALYGSPVRQGSPANVAETAQLLERVLSDPAANIRSLDAFTAAPAARPSTGPTIGSGTPGASPEETISRALAAGTIGAAAAANPATVARAAAQGLKGAGIGGSLLGAATGAALNPDNPLPHALDWGAMALSPVGYAALSPGEAQAGPLSKYLQQLIDLTKSRYGAGTPMERAEALLQEVNRQAPASFKAYRSDQLLSHIADAAQPGAQDRMMLATPAQFQRLAMPRPLSEESDAQVASLAAMLKNRTSTPDAYGEDYYAKRYPRFEGFGDVPMLRYGDVDNLPFARVLGHEGRHRLAAAGEVLGDYEPLAIRAFGYDPAELQAATNLAQVLPESPSKRLAKMYMGAAGQDPANQDFLKLFMEPQLQPLDNFKEGGPVKLAGGGSVLGQLKKLLAPALTPSYVVKPEGGQWLTGSVEEALKGLKRGDEPAIQAIMRANPTITNEQAREFINAQPNPSAAALNSWISGPLTKYVKQRMSTPSDEIRQLAEQGVLHFEPPMAFPAGMEGAIKYARVPAGFPAEGVGENPLARNWELASDRAIQRRVSEEYLPQSGIWEGLSKELKGNPWIANLPEGTSVYNPFAGVVGRELGFSHLTDELANALNPASGLPPALQLNPANLNRLSVKDAVQRVAAINKWRAEQQAAANAELANKASVVREYPHSEATPNPKGLRWVELKAGEGPESEQQLEQQLKYEGDTMGHCVGGYCEDVLSGQSRIFSLRDAKGEPHVTVEIQPETMTPTGPGGAPAIVQIKGKQNKAPNPEYLPFVQDFVKNSPLGQPWSDVGDLQNAGLRRASDVFNNNELSILNKRGKPITPEHYLKPEEISDLQKVVDPSLTTGRPLDDADWGIGAPQQFASGGQVLPADDSALLRSFFTEAQ